MSGGQRQRLGLARTLYNNPEILILDESFNALDYRSEIEIFKKIKKKFPSITILYASHRKKNKYFKKRNTYKTQVKWAKKCLIILK